MFNFKKITSILASAVMLSSTMGFAMAASYPEPFVTTGTADAAVVWGANAAVSDLTSAIDVQQNLGALITSSKSTTSVGVVGEAVALFSGGTKLYINDTLNLVKTTVTKDNLPNILKETTFSGDVDSKVTQIIEIGPDPKITFEKQPTSSTDPVLGIKTSTTNTKPMWNATATFSKAVNFSHADSEGETINLFGMDFTISASTDTDSIILLKSAEKLSLDSNNPSGDVTIDGSIYTIELVSSSDTAATIKVTDSSGKAESKEINEASSKKVNGITIAVTVADETNLKLSATVVAGSDKITLEDGGSVLRGESDEVIDGTIVEFYSGNPNNLTKLTIGFDAPTSDKDSINVGESYIDPVFGTMKLNFAGLNIDRASTARETIEVKNSGDDLMTVSFTEHRGKKISTQFAKNGTKFFELMRNNDNENISVRESEILNVGDFVVVGNEANGYLLKLESTANSSTSGTGNDKARFIDVASGDTIDTTWTSEGTGSLTVGGLSYTVTMTGDSTIATGDTGTNVTIDYPDSGTNILIAYPTISTSKGAKFSFYEPVIVNLTGADNTPQGTHKNLTEIKIPDGDGYESITITSPTGSLNANQSWVFAIDGTGTFINTSNNLALTTLRKSVTGQIGKLVYNITNDNNVSNTVKIYLMQPGGGNIDAPALVLWEEKDDNNEYHAVVLTLENGATSDDGIGVNDVEDTWSNDSGTWESSLKSKTTLADDIDLWGTIATLDTGDSDQTTAVISYPDDQVYGQIYMAEASAAITPGSTSSGGGGQVLIVKDSELTSVSGKNLVIVGGSCINTAAAKILDSDSPLCASMFTEKTGVGAGQYIIKTVKSPWSDSKVAMLVAGYEATDTVNAVKKALEGVKSDAGTSQVYPIASA